MAGQFSGFNGKFTFDYIGQKYEDGVPYIMMRLVPAACGILAVPVMFLTLRAAGCQDFTACLGAGLVIFGMYTLLLLSNSAKMLRYTRQCPYCTVSFHSLGLALHSRHGYHCT